MRTYKHFLIFGTLLGLTAFAKASDSKDAPLQGYVTDAITKKPVGGVVVSVILPGSSNSSQVITNNDGYYKFSQIPATQFALQFDKKGYQPFKKSGVVVKEKSPVKLNVEFSPSEEETDDLEFPVFKMFQLN